MEELRNIELNTYKLFSLKDYITYAKMLKNYDGDTANIIFMFEGIPMHVKARLYGYDCSEMKPSLNDPNRDEKKKKALEAKKRLWYLCTKEEEEKSHKTLIKIKCGNYDKYGRLLITVFNEDYEIDPVKTNDELFKDSINNQMINEGHGYTYYGGTKQDF
jgi:endonuclease YncB( thermonuclease family)